MNFQPTTYGKYVLLDRIAIGGMAEVFKAKTFGVHGFERLLVIKRILPDLSKDEEFVQMFIDEAKIVVELMHANICQVTDLGKIGDNYFIAMEYIDGKDLRAILKKVVSTKLPFTVPQAIYIAIEILKGLDYAHKKIDPISGKPLNLIHRDISPQNIMVSYHGDVKIVDFGIAKTESRLSRTHAGVLKGKFGYMSPEQAAGLDLDSRTDIFSSGILLYEMLSRRRLFLGQTDFETLEKIKECQIPSIAKYNPAVTPDLEKILTKLLAKEREERFASAQEAYVALSAYLYTNHPTFSSNDLAVFCRKLFTSEIEQEQEALRRSLDSVSPSEVAKATEAAEISREGTLDSKAKTPSTLSPSFKLRLPWKRLRSVVRRLPPSATRIVLFACAVLVGLGLGWKLLHRTSPIHVDRLSASPTPAGSMTVQISSEPIGAMLYIDGIKKSTTPATLDLVPRKLYVARFEKKGFKPLEKQIFISQDQKTYSGYVLQPDLPAVGQLHVFSRPPGARIFIDQTQTSLETPATLKDVSLNVSHLVKVQLDGYESAMMKVILEKPERDIEFTLKPNIVTLRLKIDPSNATVYLDGEERGHVIEKITSGVEHTLRIEAPGYQTVTRKVKVSESEELAIDLKKMDAMFGTITLRAHPYALIYVDGKMVHQGPGIADYKLSVGTHTFEFRHPYNKPVTKRIAVRPGKNDPIVIDWK